MYEGKNNNFGVVRLMAALFVITGHMHILAGETAPVLFGIPIQEIGVDIFLSWGGYLISRSGQLVFLSITHNCWRLLFWISRKSLFTSQLRTLQYLSYYGHLLQSPTYDHK